MGYDTFSMSRTTFFEIAPSDALSGQLKHRLLLHTATYASPLRMYASRDSSGLRKATAPPRDQIDNDTVMRMRPA